MEETVYSTTSWNILILVLVLVSWCNMDSKRNFFYMIYSYPLENYLTGQLHNVDLLKFFFTKCGQNRFPSLSIVSCLWKKKNIVLEGNVGSQIRPIETNLKSEVPNSKCRTLASGTSTNQPTNNTIHKNMSKRRMRIYTFHLSSGTAIFQSNRAAKENNLSLLFGNRVMTQEFVLSLVIASSRRCNQGGGDEGCVWALGDTL